MEAKVIIFTIIGMFVDCMLLVQYMDAHILKKSKKIYIIIGYLMFFLINCILGIIDIPFMFRTVSNLIMIICIGYLFYEKISIYALGKEAIIFILLLGVSELLLIPIVFLLTGKYDAQIFSDPNQSHLWLLSLGLSRLIAVLLFKVSRRIQKQSYLKLSRNELIILYFPLGISLTAFMAIAKFVLDIDKFEKENLSIPISIIAVVLIFSTVLHMLFFEKYMRDRENEKEIRLLKQKNKLQYEYYKKQMEAFENIRILYHDLKNHMLLLQNDSTYYKGIDAKLKEFEGFVNTGSDILNVLLWQKSSEAIEKGIEAETVVEEIDMSFIDDMDLCSIVGNILDNAIEACCEIDRNCIPEIFVRIGKVNNFIVFKVENDCIINTRHKSKKGVGFETTKKEKNIHGIGLFSVTKAVEKYDGHCEFKCNGNKFCSEILIPIPIMQ